jgi:hypothetical protein
MVTTAAHFGSQSVTPALWLYGDNDSLFPANLWRAMFARYTAAGGPAELVELGRFLSDSHKILGFPEGLRLWAPRVDAFLHRISMPNAVTHPEYLPVPFPPPSNFAAVGNIDAVPHINDEGRQTYQKFLADPMPRVFVFSRAGLAAAFDGGFDPLGRALNACKQHAQDCQVYAADDYVSWMRPTPAPPATKFASVDDATPIPYVGLTGREGYEKYLAQHKPKAFAIAPDGGWFFSALGEDPLVNAMGSCGKVHASCRLYAVDDSVVW